MRRAIQKFKPGCHQSYFSPYFRTMNPFTRTLLAILGILAVAAFVWFFRDIVVYVVVAVILTLMGRPITRLLRKVHFRGRYLPDAVSAIVAMAVLVGTFMAMISFFIPTLLQQTNNLLSVDVNTIANGLEEPINWVNELNQTYRFADDDFSVESYVQENLINVLESVQLANIANAIVGFTGDFFIGIFSVLFITFFFLKEKGLMHDMVMTLTPTKHEQKVNHILSVSKELLTRYFIGVVAEVLLVGGLISIGLGFLRVENAFVIGIFAGLFNVIPYVGPIIGGILGVSFAVLGALDMEFYSEMLPLILKVLVVITGVQLIDNFVFQPYIYSSSVKAHPLEIFFVILMASSIAGIGGMIVAIPVYTILRVIAKEFFNQFKLIQSLTRSI